MPSHPDAKVRRFPKPPAYRAPWLPSLTLTRSLPSRVPNLAFVVRDHRETDRPLVAPGFPAGGAGELADEIAAYRSMILAKLLDQHAKVTSVDRKQTGWNNRQSLNARQEAFRLHPVCAVITRCCKRAELVDQVVKM